jgi:23S rRNA pseudouridine1911/1915/1917 synthase
MTNKTIKFLIDEDDLGKRLDVVLSEKINYLTRSYIKKIIESGNVKINQ